MNKCICGDEENQHIDNMEQCVIPECGCKQFESAELCIVCGMPQTATGDNPSVKDYELIDTPDGWIHRICREDGEDSNEFNERLDI